MGGIPFYLVFELLGPIIEVAGYVFIITCAWMGWLSWPEAGIFLGLAIGLACLLSTSAIMLEELSFHMYPRVGQLVTLYVVAVLENFGFRQLTAFWRFQGLVRWLRGGRHEWETLTRSASLSDEALKRRSTGRATRIRTFRGPASAGQGAAPTGWQIRQSSDRISAGSG